MKFAMKVMPASFDRLSYSWNFNRAHPDTKELENWSARPTTSSQLSCASLFDVMAGGLTRNRLQNLLSLKGIRDLVFLYVVWKYFISSYRHLRARGVRKTINETYIQLATFGFKCALRVPSIHRKVTSQLDDASADMEKKLAPKGPGIVRWLELPQEGKSSEWLTDELQSLSELPSSNWQSGKVSGTVYHGGEELEQVISSAMNKYIISNPLHPDVFPGVRKMEAEVVKMVLELFNAPSEAGGTVTSGGTESILMACKSYRDWARDVKGITEPEMIAPNSIHAAFPKAAHYFGIKIHYIPVDVKTRRVDIARVKRAINANTVMLCGSAPNYPDGAIDDITALGKLAKRYNLGLHVDCCLGSFLVPFVEKCGFEMVPFDFRVEGVTSISCDTHKYGFAPKGNSTEQRNGVNTNIWFSRPGPEGCSLHHRLQDLDLDRSSLVHGCIDVHGKRWYLKAVDLLSVLLKIRKSIREEFRIRSSCKPLVSVVAFKDKKGMGVNIYQLGDYLGSKGWHPLSLEICLSGRFAISTCMHIACTKPTTTAIDTLIQDLKEGVATVKGEKMAVKGTWSRSMVWKFKCCWTGLSGRLGQAILGHTLFSLMSFRLLSSKISSHNAFHSFSHLIPLLQADQRPRRRYCQDPNVHQYISHRNGFQDQTAGTRPALEGEQFANGSKTFPTTMAPDHEYFKVSSLSQAVSLSHKKFQDFETFLPSSQGTFTWYTIYDPIDPGVLQEKVTYQIDTSTNELTIGAHFKILVEVHILRKLRVHLFLPRSCSPKACDRLAAKWKPESLVRMKTMEESHPFSPEEFNVFDSALIDPTGMINLTAGIPLGTLKLLCAAAQRTASLLKSDNDVFAAVFSRPSYSFASSFDYHFVVKISNEDVQRLCSSSPTSGDPLKFVKPRSKSLTTASSDPIVLQIGLVLDLAHAFNLVTYGPAPDSSPIELEEFCKFWGDRSDLRRFQDGSIKQCVNWDVRNPLERMQIVKQIIRWLLIQKLVFKDDGSVVWDLIGDFDDFLLENPNQFLPSLLCQLKFESSGKWPEGLEAIQKIKRLYVYLREETSRRHYCPPDKIPFVHVYRQIIKRWFSTHMLLSTHVSVELVELLASVVYLLPEDELPPTTGSSGFVRFLKFLKRWDWKNEPLLIPLQSSVGLPTNALTHFPVESVQAALQCFRSTRKKDPGFYRYTYFVATEDDLEGSRWLLNSPGGTDEKNAAEVILRPID
ncbi:hypothetical protein H4Q26_012102 [Puccinia striiformis f. sp. tritici PST-130]|nr:hypothetical protein H4Q26_012102 [Puccinia striiformis f. sp. tritici PST-130]